MDDTKKTISIDASELPLRPGYFPDELVYLGNAFRKITGSEEVKEDDLISVLYAAADGRTLIVYND